MCDRCEDKNYCALCQALDRALEHAKGKGELRHGGDVPFGN